MAHLPGSGWGGGGVTTACISPLINSWSMLGEGNLLKEPQRADVWSMLGASRHRTPATLIREDGRGRCRACAVARLHLIAGSPPSLVIGSHCCVKPSINNSPPSQPALTPTLQDYFGTSRCPGRTQRHSPSSLNDKNTTNWSTTACFH